MLEGTEKVFPIFLDNDFRAKKLMLTHAIMDIINECLAFAQKFFTSPERKKIISDSFITSDCTVTDPTLDGA